MSESVDPAERIWHRWCDPSAQPHEDHHWTDEDGVWFYCPGGADG